eukprot:GHUV01025615.1.p2 GENE.GHUV01025615.1~~GHUV01025615.1.p2  ORF type:complete len:129 (+),score=47.48 GHUV01025615.1:964-1350(+)
MATSDTCFCNYAGFSHAAAIGHCAFTRHRLYCMCGRVHMRTKFKKESKVDPERVDKAMSGAALDEQELAELSAVVQAAVEANEDEPDQPQQQHEQQPAAQAGGEDAGGDGEADHLEELRPPGSISVAL